jgi:hypothetical protein
MSPQEKAKELFGRHYIICQEYTEEIQCSIQAKQCALILVDEMIKQFEQLKLFVISLHWSQVKREIKKL